MKITALEAQKHNPDRLNVYLDGEFAFGLDMNTAVRLRVGQDLSEAEIAELQKTDGVARAFERAVRFLAARPRSVYEVRRKLQEKQTPASAIDTAMERLTALGYVDDLAFARTWVENRQTFRPRSTAALRAELKAKGVEEAIIRQVLHEVDNSESALQVARQQVGRWRGEDSYTLRQKLSSYLIRRGYDYDTVRTTTDIVIEELEE